MAHDCRFLAVVLVAFGCASAWGQPPGGAATFVDGIDCRQLASMPNPPMTVGTCEAQVAAHRNVQQSMAQPGGERAGDERLTCDQIAAEMKQSMVTPLPQKNVAEGVAAAREVQEAQRRVMADAAATSATQTARTAAASAGPNAVQGAVAGVNAAEQQALAARSANQIGPASNRLNAANAATQNDLAAMMRSNPRFARLMQLGAQKNCTFTDQ